MTVVLHAAKPVEYFKRNHFLVLFSLLWIAGILVGFGLFCICKPFLFLQMRSSILQPVSIVGLCLSIFLPLLCTVLSVLLDRPILALAVCFIKAASFSFSLSWISSIYGTASWLVYMLFMFSDICFLLILFICWFRFPCSFNAKVKRFFCVAILLGLLIALGDYFVISPFLVRLF